MRRAVSRAAPLAYQHSLMIFAITRSACRGRRGREREKKEMENGKERGTEKEEGGYEK